MKNNPQKYRDFLATVAIVFTTMNAYTACVCIMHQDSLTDAAKNLHKF